MTEHRTPTQSEQLEQRLAWLEWKMVQILYALIAIVSLGVGIGAYFITKDVFDHWIAIMVGAVAWMLAGSLLQRMEFKGAPKNIRVIDP